MFNNDILYKSATPTQLNIVYKAWFKKNVQTVIICTFLIFSFAHYFRMLLLITIRCTSLVPS